MNKFKEKQEEWKAIQKYHLEDTQKKLQEYKENSHAFTVFATTCFCLQLPEEIRDIIYHFVVPPFFLATFFNRYTEMFTVIGNYLYDKDLKKKKNTFAISQT